MRQSSNVVRKWPNSTVLIAKDQWVIDTTIVNFSEGQNSAGDQRLKEACGLTLWDRTFARLLIGILYQNWNNNNKQQFHIFIDMAISWKREYRLCTMNEYHDNAYFKQQTPFEIYSHYHHSIIIITNNEIETNILSSTIYRLVWLHLAMNDRLLPIQLQTADALWPNRLQGIGSNLGDRTRKKVHMKSCYYYTNFIT